MYVRVHSECLSDADNKFATTLKSFETSCIETRCLQILLGQMRLMYCFMTIKTNECSTHHHQIVGGFSFG